MFTFGDIHMFSKAKITELKARFASVDVNSIEDASLKAKARKLKKQAGFTLLELLVVVAILAAVAGTATIALKDTDARASAAAHVAMMDELNKGIRTFRVLRKNQLPNNFDSLIQVATDPATGTALDAPIAYENLAIEDVAPVALPAKVVETMAAGGVSALQYVSNAQNPEGDGDCTAGNIGDLINDKNNAVVPGNIFMTADGNGCGVSRTLEAGDTAMIWTGGTERLTGQPEAAGVTVFDGTNAATATSAAYLVTGIGPASTLFDANDLGGMTTVPVYRHVSGADYNRFMAVWNIGTFKAADGIDASDQIELVSILDGAGDTKEEELGEWDGSRNTI